MAVASELSKIDSETFEKVKSVIALFRMMGITDEMLDRLPQILKCWPTIVKNMNAMGEDLENLKRTAYEPKPSGNGGSGDTPDSLRHAVGFGEAVERVIFEKGVGEHEQ